MTTVLVTRPAGAGDPLVAELESVTTPNVVLAPSSL